MAMADDGMLPRVVARRNRRGVPWVSVLLCGLAWALALKLPFERLISIDLILYGSSLLARVRRPRRSPHPRAAISSGHSKPAIFAFACLLGVGPAALIGYALYASRDEKIIGSTSALLFAVCRGAARPALYWSRRPWRAVAWPPPRTDKSAEPPQTRPPLRRRGSYPCSSYFLSCRFCLPTCFPLLSSNCLAAIITRSRA